MHIITVLSTGTKKLPAILHVENLHLPTAMPATGNTHNHISTDGMSGFGLIQLSRIGYRCLKCHKTVICRPNHSNSSKCSQFILSFIVNDSSRFLFLAKWWPQGFPFLFNTLAVSMPLIALGHLALISNWWLSNWCLGVWVGRFKPGTGDNTDTTPTRLAPPTLRPIELTSRCLYVLERPPDPNQYRRCCPHLVSHLVRLYQLDQD